jgi:hypothetical protein
MIASYRKKSIVSICGLLQNIGMDTANSVPVPPWRLIVRNTAIVLVILLVSLLLFSGLKYLQWRNRMIEWDYGSIHRTFGGQADEDRIRKIEFIKEWEYKALKRTRDGQDVWLHVLLTKRHCGNWMFVDATQRNLVRPLELRYPDGLPSRAGAVSCLGIPLD